MKLISTFFLLALTVSASAFAQQSPTQTYEELPFLKEFAGKNAEYI